MLILYKNDRNVRFVLFTKTSNIVWIVTGTLMDRMGFRSILPVKDPITIGTVLNLDADFDGHDDGEITCKQTFIRLGPATVSTEWFLKH